jgi:hypothetical protein
MPGYCAYRVLLDGGLTNSFERQVQLPGLAMANCSAAHRPGGQHEAAADGWRPKRKAGTGEAIHALLGLQARTARVVRDDVETEIPIADVAVGDEIIIRPGEKVPVDATVMSGSPPVDLSMITCEPIPITKHHRISQAVTDRAQATTPPRGPFAGMVTTVQSAADDVCDSSLISRDQASPASTVDDHGTVRPLIGPRRNVRPQTTTIDDFIRR